MTTVHEFPAAGRGALRSALRAMLRPGIGFERPDDVLKDPDLTDADKRAVLASWASDACAVPGRPGWRRMLGSETEVPLIEVMEALERLDHRGGAFSRMNPWPPPRV